MSFDYKNHLYDYQLDSFHKILVEPKGKIVLPTGLGKTRIQAASIAHDIRMNPNFFRMYLINAPRIILTYQLLKECYHFMTNVTGITARFYLLHSGRKADMREINKLRMIANASGYEIPFIEINSSASPKELHNAIKDSETEQIPIVIISTYHSMHKVEDIRKEIGIPISMIINDEAHHLTNPTFFRNYQKIKSTRHYFFTATTKETVSTKSTGMNNVDVYGNLLYGMTPLEAINRGKMCRPKVHLVQSDKIFTSDEFEKNKNHIIYNLFLEHREHLKNNHPSIGAKLLVAINGASDIKNFLKSREYRMLRMEGVEIFGIHSHEEIKNNHNGDKIDRQNFLQRLRQCGSEDKKEIIALHYDILTEGIDIPSFTGVAPFRVLTKGKFIQTLGRIARLHVEDRRNLDGGTIRPNEYDKMLKPYSYVLLPILTETTLEDAKQITMILDEVCSYGFNPSEDFIGDVSAIGIDSKNPFDDFHDKNRKNTSTGRLIDTYFSKVQEDKLTAVSTIEYLEQHLPPTRWTN